MVAAATVAAAEVEHLAVAVVVVLTVTDLAVRAPEVTSLARTEAEVVLPAVAVVPKLRTLLKYQPDPGMFESSMTRKVIGG